jgi:hypothetical protein
MKCEKCGHINESSVSISSLPGWENALETEVVRKLKSNKIGSVASNLTLTDGTELAYRTLFVSTISRQTLMDRVMGVNPDEPLKVFKAAVVPVLNVIDKNFNILGALALPSAVDLAITDLNQPVCVFTFVAVEAALNLEQKLKDLGLEDLLQEGMVSTVDRSKDWVSVANEA